MGSVRVFQVDAFTSQRFTGNPAGVVLDADGLSDAQMQALARELNNGDTAFVLRPDGLDHDVRVRFLTRHGEAAFVGHATLAVHGVLAALGEAARPRQKQLGGIVRIEVLAGGATPRLAIRQPPPRLLGAPDPTVLGALLEALELTPSELDGRCAPLLAGASSPRLLLGVRTAATLARLRPEPMRLAALSERLGAPGVFLYTLSPEVPGVHTEARMFCPALGIVEDPVSGNAHALLGVYLWQRGLLPPPIDAATPGFSGAQGHHMQRPGRVRVTLSARGDTLEAVSIIGETVVAFATTLEFKAA